MENETLELDVTADGVRHAASILRAGGHDLAAKRCEDLIESRQRLRAKINLIQQIQSEDMPEPWRTRICDVIANGVCRPQ